MSIYGCDKEISKNTKCNQEIFNWFYSLTINERLKATMITNSILTKALLGMYSKYSYNKKKKFRLNYDEDTFQNFSEMSANEEVNEDEVIEGLFLGEVRFCSIKSENDTLILSPYILKDKELLEYYLNHFSKNKSFDNFCAVKDKKTITCDFPNWFNLKEYSSLCTIISAHFEVEINQNYQRSKKKVFNIDPISQDILIKQNEFLEKRDIVINYFINPKHSEIPKEIMMLKIIEKVVKDSKIKNNESKMNIKNYFFASNNATFQLFEPPCELNSREIYEEYERRFIKEEEKIERDEKLIDDFIFSTFEKIDKIYYFIDLEIYEAIYKVNNEEVYKDLIEELEEENRKKKNKIKDKKKKKKKKKRKKKSEDETNQEPQEEDIEEIKISSDTPNTEGFTIITTNPDSKENEAMNMLNKLNINSDIKSDNNLTSNGSTDVDGKENGTSKQENEEELNKTNFNNSIIKNNFIVKDDKPKETAEKEKQSKKSKKKPKKPILFNTFPVHSNSFPDLVLTQKEQKTFHQKYYNSNNFKQLTIPEISHPNNLQSELHNVILDTANNIIASLSSKKDEKYRTLTVFLNKIKKFFNKDITIDIYGSYSTGLQIDSSDIDISIGIVTLQSPSELISSIYSGLSSDPFFTKLFPIPTAKVPILKIEIDKGETKIDLTFNLNNQKQTDYTNKLMKKYEEIKPLTMMLKKLISHHKLNSAFDGGISSHTVFLMVASYIKIIKNGGTNYNLGECLLDLLYFYGNFFNFSSTTIDITKKDPFCIGAVDEYQPVPIIIDPISKKNVAKSSYNYKSVLEVFSSAYTELKTSTNIVEAFNKLFN